MDLNSTITFCPTVFAQEVDDEMVLLDMNSENYFGLDGVATDIWKILEKENVTLENVLKELLTIYDVKEESLKEDIFTFIKELEQRELISVIKV